MYQGKGLTPEFRSIVDRINEASEAEIFVTENLRQLGACLPFEVEYDALITREERARLVAGHTVSKVGYEERFGRQIMAVIVPLLDEKRLEGASYPLRAPPPAAWTVGGRYARDICTVDYGEASQAYTRCRSGNDCLGR